MNLKDFYFADRHAAGTKMPILLPSGEDSGEWLQVRGPDCDEAIKAGRAFTAAVRQIDVDLSALEKECEATKDYTRWNEQRGWRTEDLYQQLAVELICGWSFDDDYTPAAVAELLRQYRGLAEAVAKHHAESRAALSAKL